jgi:hypothetical protein
LNPDDPQKHLRGLIAQARFKLAEIGVYKGPPSEQNGKKLTFFDSQEGLAGDCQAGLQSVTTSGIRAEASDGSGRVVKDDVSTTIQIGDPDFKASYQKIDRMMGPPGSFWAAVIAPVFNGERKKSVYDLDGSEKSNEEITTTNDHDITKLNVFAPNEEDVKALTEFLTNAHVACVDQLPPADRDYQRALMKAQTDEEKFQIYFAAAAQGRLHAEFQLANAYAAGHGTPKSVADALQWYRKAADQGYGPAQTELANLYLYGWDGLPADKEQARSWFTKAADQGYVDAKNALKYQFQ